MRFTIGDISAFKLPYWSDVYRSYNAGMTIIINLVFLYMRVVEFQVLSLIKLTVPTIKTMISITNQSLSAINLGKFLNLAPCE